MQQTRLSRRWLVKIVIFLVAALGLGLWGLYDATIAYPARGRAHAEYMEHQYLAAMMRAGLSPQPIERPEEILEQLREKRPQLERYLSEAESSGRQLEAARAQAELLALEWLESLRLVGDLTPERVSIEDPVARLSELNAKWQAQDQPKPLSGFDIPMQWGFVAIGFGLGAYLVALILMVGSKKYKYGSETKRLTFPDGSTLTPDEIEDIDKSKWDKFFVKVKSGGVWRKMDLLRYDPLEAWYLEIERETPFYEPPVEDAADDEAVKAIDAGSDPEADPGVERV